MGDVVLLVVNRERGVMYVRLRGGPVISACKLDSLGKKPVSLFPSCAIRGIEDSVRLFLVSDHDFLY
jgi:hypothetical protein